MGKQRPQKKKKVELVFDQKKRHEYLTGFSKRKQERRQKAKEDLERQVKEERKRIKQEIKDGFQDQFKQSFAPIELEGVLKEQEYDTEDVSVQIVELSTDELAKTNNWIGANRPVYTDDKSSTNKGDSDEEEDDEEVNEEEVPGFTVTTTKKKKVAPKPKLSKSAKNDIVEEETINPDDPDEKKHAPQKLRDDFKSKRAMGQFFARKATNSLQHSKAFQLKNRLERVKNIKKARFEKDKRIKTQNKREKNKKNSSKPTKINKKFKRSNNTKDYRK